jgi:hypothetical protein
VIKVSHREDVKPWLQGLPRDYSVVIAARAALRVVPLLATSYERVLPVCRAVSVAWVGSIWPDVNLRQEAATAAAAADDLAEDDTFASAVARTAAWAAYAAARARPAVDAAAAVESAAAFGDEIWAAVSADIATLAGKGRLKLNPAELAARRLWPNGRPEWAKSDWRILKTALLDAGEDWEVWTAWYEGRINGQPANEVLETARVLEIEDGMWRAGPKAVNARVKELIAQYTPEEKHAPEKAAPTAPPAAGPGPHLQATPSGFEIIPKLPEGSERDSPVQISLHTQLKRRVERLNEAMGRAQNTHKQLFAEYMDYTEFVSKDLASIDIASLWSAGAALNDMVEALAQVDTAAMAEQLEPDVASQLRSLLRDHMTFIMGFAQGQELAARAAALRLLEVEPAELGRRAKAVFSPMLSASSLLAKRATILIRMLDRALDRTDDQTLALVTASVSAATRSIVAFGRAVAPVAAGTAIVASLTGVNLGTLTGDPNAETLRAALFYMRENANALAAFASHDAQLKVWLDWLISEIRRDVPPNEN